MTIFLSFKSSYLPLSSSGIKSRDVLVSGTTAFLNLPIAASCALRPSKNTTSSPYCSTSSCTCLGFKCTPPFTTPVSSTTNSSAPLKPTISSRTFTLIRGKSSRVPSLHLNTVPLKPGNSFVALIYFFRSSISPPTVPLNPCEEIKIRPRRFKLPVSVFCHSFTVSGSLIGVNL